MGQNRPPIDVVTDCGARVEMSQSPAISRAEPIPPASGDLGAQLV
jgi:hypothetical protein